MKSFAVKVEEGRKGKDGQPSVGPVYRNPLAEHGYPLLDPKMSTTWEIFRTSVEKHPSNRMLGWRELVNGKWGPYAWKTYKEVYAETLQAGSALRAHGFKPGDRVGIYGSNCPQWIVAMEACNAHSLICVPLYDTLGPGAVKYILDHAEIDVVFVQDKKVKELLNPECTHARRLKLIICFTSLAKEQNDEATSFGIKTFSWNEFLNMGKENPCDISPPKPSSICTIMYTSGTSGDPKGVILTHENATTNIRGVDLFMEQFEDKMTVDDVYISFLPLAHILDRMIEEYFFHKGASVGYYHGEINEIKDDLVELKPTFLAGVPRVYERVHEGVLKALEELNWRRRRIFDMLYRYKLYWMNRGYKQKDASPLADFIAFGKVKNRLGGRIRLIVSGGAPLGNEVEEFLRVTSCAFVVQGYGLTESCGLATLGYPDEMSMVGAVGSAFVYSEIRLEEVPEMGYDPLGDPPRGEICIRGKSPFAGYYKNPELTQEVVIDGWFHTGDIGEMLPNGVVKVIDRKKNLIKLSHGEYVALEYMEKVYSITPIVEDIWVYGSSFKSMLVAVVVPNEENTKKWAKQNGYKGSLSDLCSVDELKDHILNELKSTSERNKLRGFEYIKGVILEPELFEFSGKELVTATLKKRRDRLFKLYKVEIDLMTNDVTDINPEEAVSCFALSKNDSYVMSASGGKISLFNMMTFKTMTTFMPPPPAATFLAFHPQDNNIIAIGMDDSSIQIYNVRVDEVKSKLKGHSKRITGLAFSHILNVLVSSGADAQLCVWNSVGWEMQKSKFLQLPSGRSPEAPSETRIQFHQDQIHLLVVHETQLAIYETTKLECVQQWVPPESAPISHATFSCDSQLIYASFLDATICIFTAAHLRLRCRINPSAYMSSNISSSVHPQVIAAHPQESNQFALGLSDGSVHVIEPLESEGKWGLPPPLENGSTSNVPPNTPSVGASASEQAQR